MLGGFKATKLNTCRGLEVELVANRDESENQAGLVPGPDPVQKQNFFPKNQIRHYVHLPRKRTVSTYVREKGYLTCDTHRETPRV